jgi:hypothetical protein
MAKDRRPTTLDSPPCAAHFTCCTVERMPKQRSKRTPTWLVSRLPGSPAALIALIDAPDAASAIKAAIKQFAITPEDQKRLIAVRRDDSLEPRGKRGRGVRRHLALLQSRNPDRQEPTS